LKNLKISDFDPMRPRAGISTSEIHFTISNMVSAVRADATEVPMPKHKSSSTNGLPYRAVKCIQILKTKNFGKKIFSLHYNQKNTLNPLVKSVLNPLTIKGDICNFVTAVSALSNTSQRSVYN